ncbi:MAG: NosD domain-containing protein [Euryarchaeota archaeon]|nr:NosD domain-containing protein [Euryarchaeota archaeon]
MMESRTMKGTHSFWMKNLLFLVIVLSLITIAAHPAAAVAAAATLTVDDSGGQDYLTIQAAINNATAGDTILVYPGTYNENVDVNKQLNITSTDGAAATNVTAASSSDHVFDISVDGVTLCGFNVSGGTSSGVAGIYLLSSSNNTLTSNTASDNSYGIYLSSSSNNTLTSNTASNNSFYGIYLFSSNNNTLTSNTASNNTLHGIFLQYSSDNTLTNNTASNNSFYGICLRDSSDNNTLTNNTASNNSYGIYLLSSSNNTLTSNTVSSNLYGIYLRSSSDNNTLTSNTVSSNSRGIYLLSSSNNTLTSNTASNNTNSGIFLQSSSDSTLTNNTASNNIYYGIRLDSSSNNTLTSNTASNNTDYGIFLSYSSNNTLTSNTASNNTDNGIDLYSSNNNLIYNNLFNNSDNTYFGGTITGNVWNTTKTVGTNIAGGSYLGGNYWLTPSGTGFSQTNNTDLDGDEICDESYTHSSDNVDYLPLASPATTTPATTTPASNNDDSSSGSRASVGQSQPAQNVVSTDSVMKKVLAGNKEEYDLSGGEGPVLGISFDAKSNEGNVVTNVQVLYQLPDGVEGNPSDSQPYHTLSITVGSEDTISDDNADNILIEFKVSKEWIEENNIDPSTIRMTRYHGGVWNDLPTNKVGEDDEFLYFTAQTTGFSTFQIIGDELVEEPEPVVEEPEPVEEDTPEAPAEEDTGLPGFTAGLGIAVLGLAGLIYRRTRQ